MRFCWLCLLVLAAIGCQRTQKPVLDPFLGRSTVPPPPTGSAVPSGNAGYYGSPVAGAPASPAIATPTSAIAATPPGTPPGATLPPGAAATGATTTGATATAAANNSNMYSPPGGYPTTSSAAPASYPTTNTPGAAPAPTSTTPANPPPRSFYNQQGSNTPPQATSRWRQQPAMAGAQPATTSAPAYSAQPATYNAVASSAPPYSPNTAAAASSAPPYTPGSAGAASAAPPASTYVPAGTSAYSNVNTAAAAAPQSTGPVDILSLPPAGSSNAGTAAVQQMTRRVDPMDPTLR